jgi:dTDP-4-amino-4,6-dideoxygalactose transaminase
MSELAIFGGPRAVKSDPKDMFTWPIITKEGEKAVLEVLRAGKMSETDVTMQFEKEYAKWHGVKYALGFNTGTAALHSAMWACGVGTGDEIIGPSLTYWASVLPALNLGASIVFADIKPDTFCIDPDDIERRITKRTKAIVVVHLYGYPCDMAPIMKIAKKHGIKVIEDVSHAHGALYKGKLVGTIGDVGCFSIMSGKALACGEGGMLITNDKKIYERSMAFGHYERTLKTKYAKTQGITLPELKKFAGLPLGGFKYRMHQLTSALGRVQLKDYRKRMKEIQRAINYFWDLLEGEKGIRPCRPERKSGSTMGGWYVPHGIYVPHELGNLPVEKFCEALRAEGCPCGPGTANGSLHLHPLFHDADIYNHGKPTIIANAERDLRQGRGSLPVTESIRSFAFTVPYFKHYRPQIIKEYVLAFKKIIRNYKDLK